MAYRRTLTDEELMKILDQFSDEDSCDDDDVNDELSLPNTSPKKSRPGADKLFRDPESEEENEPAYEILETIDVPATEVESLKKKLNGENMEIIHYL